MATMCPCDEGNSSIVVGRESQTGDDFHGPGQCRTSVTEAAELGAITPHCCQLSESIRLFLRCIRTPSIFRTSLTTTREMNREAAGQRLGLSFGRRGATIAAGPSTNPLRAFHVSGAVRDGSYIPEADVGHLPVLHTRQR